MRFPALSLLLVVLLLSTSARAQLVSEPLPMLWRSEFPSAPEHYHAQIEAQSDGGAILLFQHRPFLIEPLAQSWLVRVDANGLTQWRTRVFAHANQGPAMAIFDGGIAIYQHQRAIPALGVGGEATLRVLRSADGSVQWEQVFSGVSQDEPTSHPITLSSRGEILLPLVRQNQLEITRITTQGLARPSLHWTTGDPAKLRALAIASGEDASIWVIIDQERAAVRTSTLLQFDASGILLASQDLQMRDIRAIKLNYHQRQLYIAATHNINELSVLKFDASGTQRWRRDALVNLGEFFLHDLKIDGADRAALYFSVDNAPGFLGSILVSIDAEGTLSKLRHPTTPSSLNYLGKAMVVQQNGRALTVNFATAHRFELIEWSAHRGDCGIKHLDTPPDQFIEPLAVSPTSTGGWFIAAANGGQSPDSSVVYLWKTARLVCEATLLRSGFDEREYFLPLR